MKTFSQFNEDIAKELEGIAKSFSMDKSQQRKLAGQITGTVLNKLTGGQKGREKAINKVSGQFKKMGDELPGAVNQFSDFLKSGKIEQGFNKMNTQMQQGMKKYNR